MIWHKRATSANEVMAQIKALPEREQAKLARLLVEETDWLEDVVDAAIAKARMDFACHPLFRSH